MADQTSKGSALTVTCLHSQDLYAAPLTRSVIMISVLKEIPIGLRAECSASKNPCARVEGTPFALKFSTLE